MDLRDGSWHHVAGVLDRAEATARVYVDGKLKKSVSTTGFGAINDLNSPLSIGREFTQTPDSPAYNFKGDLREVRIRNTALSSVDIQADLAATHLTGS